MVLLISLVTASCSPSLWMSIWAQLSAFQHQATRPITLFEHHETITCLSDIITVKTEGKWLWGATAWSRPLSKLVYSPTFHFGLDSHVFLYISASCCPLRQSCKRKWNHVYDNNTMAVYYKFFCCFFFFFLLVCVCYVSKVFLITVCGNLFFDKKRPYRKQ